MYIEGAYNGYDEKLFISESVNLLSSETQLFNSVCLTYKAPLRLIVEAKLRENAVSRMISLTSIPTRVFGVLTQGIYDSHMVFIRELCQNSIDATRVRQITSKDTIAPRIVINIETHDGTASGTVTLISVTDNGVGMDAVDVEERLFRIGETIKRSPSWSRAVSEGKASQDSLIAEFGIGFLSVVSVATHLEIVTARSGMQPLFISLQSECQTTGNLSDRQAKIIPLKNEVPVGTTVFVAPCRTLTGTEISEAVGHFWRGGNSAGCEIRLQFSTRARTSGNPAGEYFARRHISVMEQWESLNPAANNPIPLDTVKLMFGSSGVIVLQEGILVEERADDLLPKALRGELGLAINVRSGVISVTASRSSFRREPKSLSALRRMINSQLWSSLHSEMIVTKRPLRINCRPRNDEETRLFLLVEWAFGRSRSKSWFKRVIESIGNKLVWEEEDRVRVRSIAEIAEKAAQYGKPVIISPRGHGSTTWEVGRIGDVTLYAQPGVRPQTVRSAREHDTLVLSADERGVARKSKVLLWGTTIMRAVLFQRGVSIQQVQPSGTIREALGDSTNLRKSDVTRNVLMLAPENTYHAVTSSSCLFVEKRKRGVFLIVNLLSPILRGIGDASIEGRSSRLRRKVVRVMLLVAGLKLNHALRELGEIMREID